MFRKGIPVYVFTSIRLQKLQNKAILGHFEAYFRVFVAPKRRKIISTTQKHQESIRNYIVDLRKTYHDEKRRETADFPKKLFWGGGKTKIPFSSVSSITNSRVSCYPPSPNVTQILW